MPRELTHEEMLEAVSTQRNGVMTELAATHALLAKAEKRNAELEAELAALKKPPEPT